MNVTLTKEPFGVSYDPAPSSSSAPARTADAPRAKTKRLSFCRAAAGAGTRARVPAPRISFAPTRPVGSVPHDGSQRSARVRRCSTDQRQVRRRGGHGRDPATELAARGGAVNGILAGDDARAISPRAHLACLADDLRPVPYRAIWCAHPTCLR